MPRGNVTWQRTNVMRLITLRRRHITRYNVAGRPAKYNALGVRAIPGLPPTCPSAASVERVQLRLDALQVIEQPRQLRMRHLKRHVLQRRWLPYGAFLPLQITHEIDVVAAPIFQRVRHKSRVVASLSYAGCRCMPRAFGWVGGRAQVRVRVRTNKNMVAAVSSPRVALPLVRACREAPLARRAQIRVPRQCRSHDVHDSPLYRSQNGGIGHDAVGVPKHPSTGAARNAPAKRNPKRESYH